MTERERERERERVRSVYPQEPLVYIESNLFLGEGALKRGIQHPTIVIKLRIVRASVTVFFQYLAIYNIEHLPNSIIIDPGRFKIYPSTKLTLQKIAKYFKRFAKVAKCRQIWSHWLFRVYRKSCLTMARSRSIGTTKRSKSILNLEEFVFWMFRRNFF